MTAREYLKGGVEYDRQHDLIKVKRGRSIILSADHGGDDVLNRFQPLDPVLSQFIADAINEKLERDENI